MHVRDEDRIAIARRLADAWPRRALRRTRSVRARAPGASGADRGDVRRGVVVAVDRVRSRTSADWLHADRFSALPPLLAVHLGAGNAAKRWPARRVEGPGRAIPREWLAGRGRRWRWMTFRLSSVLEPHDRLRDWTGSMTVAQTTALPRAGRPLHRRRFRARRTWRPRRARSRSSCSAEPTSRGSGGRGRGIRWSCATALPCQPCHQKVCPLADHPCMSGLASRSRLPRGDAVVVADAPGGVAACAA